MKFDNKESELKWIFHQAREHFIEDIESRAQACTNKFFHNQQKKYVTFVLNSVEQRILNSEDLLK